jgi:hypothetical protein
MYRSGAAVKTRKWRVAASVFALLVSTSFYAVGQPERVDGLFVEFPEQNPVNLGVGWNTRTGEKVPRVCIDFQSAERKYQDRRLTFDLINDNASLANALKVSISAKFKTVTGAGGSAAASFAKSTRFSSASTNIAVLAEVFQSPLYVAPTTGTQPNSPQSIVAVTGGTVDLSAFYGGNAVSLKSDLRQIASTNLGEFYRQCGDSFVAVIHQGARLIGNMTFNETSKEEREQLEVSVSGGAATWNVEGSLSNSMEKFNSASRLTINFAQFGGSGGNFPLNREGLLKAIEELPKASESAPKPFTMIVQRYDSLPSWPSSVGSTELSDLDVIASVAWQLDTLQMYADEAIYKPGWLLKFDTKKQEVQNVYDEIILEREQVKSDADKCVKENTCNRQKWQAWSDLKYKVRLPLRGAVTNLQYSVGDNSLDGMIDALAAARAYYWIETPARIRCRNENICLPQAEINKARDQIRSRIRQSIS